MFSVGSSSHSPRTSAEVPVGLWSQRLPLEPQLEADNVEE